MGVQWAKGYKGKVIGQIQKKAQQWLQSDGGKKEDTDKDKFRKIHRPNCLEVSLLVNIKLKFCAAELMFGLVEFEYRFRISI